MDASRRLQRTLPWILAGAFLAYAVVTVVAFVMGSLPIALMGAALAVIAGLALVVAPRLGLSAPVSFAEDVPNTTRGPKGTDHADPTRAEGDETTGVLRS